MTEKYIGCSGYYYHHWIGIFYPDRLPKKEWLPYYAGHFNTVEINSSFYHLPLDSSLTHWYNITPANFVFTLKGYRFITHLKKLNVDASLREVLHDFQRKSALLKEKLGCILWQLPKSQGKDLQKLETFCRELDGNVPHVFEFRHPSWYTPEVFGLLRSFGCFLCSLSAPGNLPEIIQAASDIIYIRFHGKNGWYDDNYSEDQLNQWAEKVRRVPAKKLFAYFNNDFHGFAINNGIYFSDILKDL